MEQVRRRYHFVVVGYVVTPEHVHLLFGERELFGFGWALRYRQSSSSHSPSVWWGRIFGRIVIP